MNQYSVHGRSLTFVICPLCHARQESPGWFLINSQVIQMIKSILIQGPLYHTFIKIFCIKSSIWNERMATEVFISYSFVLVQVLVSKFPDFFLIEIKFSLPKKWRLIHWEYKLSTDLPSLIKKVFYEMTAVTPYVSSSLQWYEISS